MPLTLAATDQCPCRSRSAWTLPRQKLTAAVRRRSDSEAAVNFFLENFVVLVANTSLSKILRISFYQIRSSLVEVMIKNILVFLVSL